MARKEGKKKTIKAACTVSKAREIHRRVIDNSKRAHREREREMEMEDEELEVQKARLLSLALEFGFDEESSKKCLDRLVHLYGILSIPYPVKTIPTQIKP